MAEIAENTAAISESSKNPPPANIAAHCFKPGQSGNPSGRPAKPLTERLIARIAKEDGVEAAAMVEAILKKAKKGDINAWREVADRVEGKPAQAVTGEDGGPIVFKLERIG